MSDRAAFTRAICVNPADDTARLVYADWLEDQGRPADSDRAEFIRAQVSLAAGPYCVLYGRKMMDGRTATDCGGTCSTCKLRKREHELLCRYAYDWTDPLMRGRSHRVTGATVRMPSDSLLEFEVLFTRGFISLMGCSTDGFFEFAKTVFEKHPVVDVMLSDAHVFPSSGNDTYYLGGLGRFPSRYWRGLEGLRSRAAVLAAVNAACVDMGRSKEDGADLPPLALKRGAA